MKTSRRRRFVPAAITLLLIPLGVANAQTPGCAAHVSDTSTSLDSAIVKAMKDNDVPGAAVAVVRDGKILLLTGYGCANIERNVAVDPSRTVFHVASVSKPFVALAVLQLAERGKADLHADVNRYLKGVRVAPGWNRPVTLHDLLTHTAGLEESIVGYAARTPADIRPLGEFLAAKLPKRGWAPGDVTAYSNYGYALAGYVVESVTHTPFAEYERTDVLAPLGMMHSSFAQPMPPDLARNAAASYSCVRTTCTSVAPDYRSAYPPGGLVTTADDMTRFILAELGEPIDGRKVLSDSLLRLMHERQFTNDSTLDGLTYGFAEDVFGGQPALSHAGGASGYSTAVVIVPSYRYGVFLVANGGMSGFGRVALDAIAASAFGARTVAQWRAAPGIHPVDPSGDYRSTRYAHRGVENLPVLFSGQLHVRRRSGDTITVMGLGDGNGDYVPVATNRWQKVDGHDRIAVRVRDGKVTDLFGPQSYFGTRFPATFEKLAWYDEPHFLNEALSYVIAIPLLALLVWPLVAAVVWLARRRTRLVARLRPTLGTTWRTPAVAAAVTFTALAMAFAFGFIAVSNRAVERGGGEIVYGLPASMRVLAWAPCALAVLAAVIVVATALGWRRRWWSIPGRLLFTTIAVNAVLFIAILMRWGYFPVATG